MLAAVSRVLAAPTLVISAVFATSVTRVVISLEPFDTSPALRAMSLVTLVCSSTADAMLVEISCNRAMTLRTLSVPSAAAWLLV